MLLPLACLKRYFLKVLQKLSEFVQHYQSLKSSPSCHWQNINRVFRPSIQQSLSTTTGQYSSQSSLASLAFVSFVKVLSRQQYYFEKTQRGEHSHHSMYLQEVLFFCTLALLITIPFIFLLIQWQRGVSNKQKCTRNF